MKTLTITLTDELVRTIERQRQGFENPPEFDEIVQFALEEYLASRGHIQTTSLDDLHDIIPATGPKPTPLEDAPVILDGSLIADAVIEDRR